MNVFLVHMMLNKIKTCAGRRPSTTFKMQLFNKYLLSTTFITCVPEHQEHWPSVLCSGNRIHEVGYFIKDTTFIHFICSEGFPDTDSMVVGVGGSAFSYRNVTW